MKLARVLVVTMLGGLAAFAPAAASAGASHPAVPASQPHDISGGYVRVFVKGVDAHLSITRESAWDVFDPKPKCLKPFEGRHDVDFDINWRAISRKAGVPGVRVSIATADKIPMAVALGYTGTCKVFTNYHFTAQPPQTQYVLGGVFILGSLQRIGKLRVHIDGHLVRLKLKHGCHPLFGGSSCPHRTVHIS